jgi:hypothetical protein
MRQMTQQELQLSKWMGGAALGALAMYLLDPERGGPRRALSGEKIRGLTRQTGSALENALRGIGSRLGRARETIMPETAPQESTSRPDGLDRKAAEQVQQLAAVVTGERSPAMRNAAMLGGGALGAYGLMRRSPLALALCVLGVTLLARGPGKLSRSRSSEKEREQTNLERGAAQQDAARPLGAFGKFLH